MPRALEAIASRTSRQLVMRDGVRLTVDLWLPRARAAPIPTILLSTRYLRSVRWSPVARAAGLDALLDIHGTTRRRFLEEGYAWVDVDARGSGCSEGTRPCPWFEDEVRDAAEVVDWIVREPWSNGRVGATGVSYAGTAAEMLLVNGHPAVRAVAPRFSLFDVYADVAFPGGLHNAWFTEAWARYNALLDRNEYSRAVGLSGRVNLAALRTWAEDEERVPLARALAMADHPMFERAVATVIGLVAAGVRPPDADPAAALRAALRCHADNSDVHEGALRITHRDDLGISEVRPDDGIDTFSPHAHADRITASGAAVFGVTGWLDGAYQRSAVARHRTLPAGRSWVQIGPWDHGGRQNVSPFDPAYATDHDHDGELVAFFDAHLRGKGEWDRSPIRYFTMGEERWKSADRWPPGGTSVRTLFLARGGRLAAEAPPDPGADRYEVDADVGTGERSRWRSLLGLAAPVGYGDRARLAQRMRCYDGDPLPAPIEVTGHPVVHLSVAANATDAAVFTYLEDVAPNGRATYVTEGLLRALHRRHVLGDDGLPSRSFRRADATPLRPGELAELVIELLPTSYRVPAGHRLRLSIACADRDHFRPLDASPTHIHVRWGGPEPSRLLLPVVPSP